jgi:hypothetical protein
MLLPTVDMATSIFQERWQTVDAYLLHLAATEELYLSFLYSIVVCKLDIIGTDEATKNGIVRKMFEPFHPKFTVLDIERIA